MHRTSLAVIATALLVAVAAVASALAGDRTTVSCGRGIPPSKCDPGGAVAAPGNRPVAVAAPVAYWPSPDVIPCGSGFFPPAVVARLSSQFGTVRCFRFAPSDRWIVFADGMRTSGDGAAPGGAMVAVAACAGAQRSRCLDPEAPHEFAGFVVVRPPDPGAWPARLQGSFGSRLLYVADGPCGVLTLDLKTLRWLAGTTETIDSAMTGGAPPAVAPANAESGATALSARAPAAVGCPS